MIKNASTKRQIGRIAMTGFLVLSLVLGYVGQATLTVHAQAIPDAINTSTAVVNNAPQYSGVEQSIKDYLCVPDEANLGTALYTCITKLYRFGIAFGAIALVFFVVFAGYMYISGGEASKTKGKEILLSAITGMAVILSSYVLLGFINPELVKIKTIQPPIFSANPFPKCEDVGFGVNCILPTGQIQYSGGSGGTASASLKQYSAIISKYATENKIDFCALNALLELESSGIYNNVSNGPPNRVDPNHPDKKFYGLPFTRAAKGSSLRGHGIGLGQIYIYGPPPSGSDGDAWSPSGTPSRPGKQFGFDRPLTITDLINPDNNIKAAAYHFAQVKLPSHPGNYADAYASAKNSYHGAGSINGVNVNTIYKTKFNACKAGSS